MSATHTGTLTKTPLGLGLTIDPNNIIATVKEGSQAEREGHFAVGDLVLTVNGEPPAPGQGVTAIIQSLPMGAQLEFAMQRAAMGVIVATPGPTEDNGLCRGSIADVAERAIDEAYKIKYEKLKQRAKWLNAAAALLLCGVSGMSLAGTGGHCSPMLIKVVMCWMSVIGAVLLLAELHVEKVLAYVHVLSYRSGRALIALMAGTITLAAAPSEIPMYATPSTPITLAPAAARHLLCAAQVQCRSRPGRPLSDERQGGPLTLTQPQPQPQAPNPKPTSIQWEFVFVGLLVIAGAVYNIRLTTRSKSHKDKALIKQNQQASQSGTRELV